MNFFGIENDSNGTKFRTSHDLDLKDDHEAMKKRVDHLWNVARRVYFKSMAVKTMRRQTLRSAELAT